MPSAGKETPFLKRMGIIKQTEHKKVVRLFWLRIIFRFCLNQVVDGLNESIFKKTAANRNHWFFRKCHIIEEKNSCSLVKDKSVFLKNEYLKCVPTWENCFNAGPDLNLLEWIELFTKKNKGNS